MHKVLFVTSIDPLEHSFVLNEINGLKERGLAINVACRLPTENPSDYNICNGFVGKQFSYTSALTWFVFFKISSIFSKKLKQFIDATANWKIYGAIVGTKRTIPIYKLYLATKNWNPDIIHVHFAWHLQYAIPISELTKIPIVCTVHGSDIYLENEWEKLLSNSTIKQILCISHSMRKFILEKLPSLSDKLHVVYIAIDNIYLSDTTTAPEDLRIVHIAGFRPVKNHRYLLEALKVLNDEEIDFKCYLIGDGPSREEINDLVSRSPYKEKVFFLGWLPQNEVIKVLDNSTVSILTSLSEGLPTSLIESLARKRSTVATRLPGTIEATNNEKYGFLVAQSQPRNLAYSILRAHEQTKTELALTNDAREFVKSIFSVSIHTDHVIRLYKKTLERSTK